MFKKLIRTTGRHPLNAWPYSCSKSLLPIPHPSLGHYRRRDLAHPYGYGQDRLDY